MTFKGFILLGLLFAVLLVTSTLAAETSNEKKKANEVKDTNDAAKSIQVDTEQKDEGKEINQYGRGRRCRYGCCGYGYYGRCFRCCKNADEAEAAERNELPNGQNLEESDQAINQAAEKYSYGDGYGGGWIGGSGGGYGWGGGPGGGGYGWGGRGGGGGYGWGGGGRGGGGYEGGGGRCRYGCCGGYDRYGGCRRCC